MILLAFPSIALFLIGHGFSRAEPSSKVAKWMMIVGGVAFVVIGVLSGEA